MTDTFGEAIHYVRSVVVETEVSHGSFADESHTVHQKTIRRLANSKAKNSRGCSLLMQRCQDLLFVADEAVGKEGDEAESGLRREGSRVQL